MYGNFQSNLLENLFDKCHLFVLTIFIFVGYNCPTRLFALNRLNSLGPHKSPFFNRVSHVMAHKYVCVCVCAHVCVCALID